MPQLPFMLVGMPSSKANVKTVLLQQQGGQPGSRSSLVREQSGTPVAWFNMETLTLYRAP